MVFISWMPFYFNIFCKIINMILLKIFIVCLKKICRPVGMLGKLIFSWNVREVNI